MMMMYGRIYAKHLCAGQRTASWSCLCPPSLYTWFQESTDFAVSIVLAELSVSLALSVTFYKSFLFGWTWIESHMLFGRGSETAAVSSLWAADMVHLPFFV